MITIWIDPDLTEDGRAREIHVDEKHPTEVAKIIQATINNGNGDD